jgi:serine/threonine protein kinase
MEFIQGDSVTSLLKKDLSKSKALKIISQVCKIVNFLHMQCIAHGDLSPENIFINKYGSVMIGDFNMKNCFCDDQRSILELIKHLAIKVGDPEGMLSEIIKIQFIQNSKLIDQVIYVIRNI